MRAEAAPDHVSSPTCLLPSHLMAQTGAKSFCSRRRRGCGTRSPLLLPHPPLLPLPGRSLLILVWPGRQKSLLALGTQFCNSTWLQLSHSEKTGNPSDTCFLLFFLQQQQQQQTPSMMRIVPPTTDIAMIRASKFTKRFDNTHLAHKCMAAWSYNIYRHTAPVTSSFGHWAGDM